MIYEHIWYLQTEEQTTQAREALDSILLTYSHVQVGEKCMTFQTPYPLGPITRGCLVHAARPSTAHWNRQPHTGQEYPISHRITWAQLSLTMFATSIVSAFLQAAGSVQIDAVIAGVVLSLIVFVLANDIDGFIKTHFDEKGSRS